MDIEFNPSTLEQQLQLISTLDDKEQVRQTFIQIHYMIKSKVEYFNPRGPCHNLVLKLVERLN